MKTALAICSFVLVVSGIVGAQTNAEPQLKRAEFPTYPALAREARIAGTVTLSFAINPDGSVAEVQALSGHPMLKTAAAANVETWRFRPGDGRGERQTAELVFKLSGKDVPSNPRLTVSLESFRRIEVTTDVLAYPAQP
jgi:TonB family protein